MTQEEKQLLLVDLSARLPYGVKVKITSRESKNRIVHLTEDNICHLTSDWWSECKPYLFPLSSMTEEQKENLDKAIQEDAKEAIEAIRNNDKMFHAPWRAIDWLNKNHFDYRGLIEKGLANDSTGLNIY